MDASTNARTNHHILQEPSLGARFREEAVRRASVKTDDGHELVHPLDRAEAKLRRAEIEAELGRYQRII